MTVKRRFSETSMTINKKPPKRFFIFGPKPPTSVGGYHHLGFA